MGIWPFNRKAPRSKTARERLEELEIRAREQTLEERRAGAELAIRAYHDNRPELLSLIETLRPSRRGRGIQLPPPYETRESKIVDALLAKALMDEDEKLDAERLRALKRRQMQRELDKLDEDDEQDSSPAGQLKQYLPLLVGALVAAPLLRDPQVAQGLGPLIQQLFRSQQPVESAPSVTVQPVEPVVPAAPVAVVPQMSPPTPTIAVTGGQTEPVGAPAPETEGADNVTLHPTMVLHAMRTMEPAACAAWILQQPGGYEFAEWLSDIPEAELAGRLQAYARMPRIGPMAQWGDVIQYLVDNPDAALAGVSAIRTAYFQESQAI